MAHTLVLDHVNTIDVRFVCQTCGQVIGFNKPGIGQPAAADLGGGSWAPPENPDFWMSPCTE